MSLFSSIQNYNNDYRLKLFTFTTNPAYYYCNYELNYSKLYWYQHVENYFNLFISLSIWEKLIFADKP